MKRPTVLLPLLVGVVLAAGPSFVGHAAAQPAAPGQTARPAAPAPDPLLGLLGDWERPITPELATLLAERAGGADRLAGRLAELAADPGRTRYVRVRAAGMLALFPTPAVRRALETLAASATDEQVRAQAVVAYGHAFWSTDRPAVERWLRARQTRGPAVVRAAAQRTLQGRLAPAPRR